MPVYLKPELQVVVSCTEWVLGSRFLPVSTARNPTLAYLSSSAWDYFVKGRKCQSTLYGVRIKC